MAITTLDQLIASYPGQHRPIYKTFTAQAIGSWVALWNMGGIPGAAPAPSPGVEGEVVDSSFSGAISWTDPTGGALAYLGKLSIMAKEVGTLMVYDRLWHNSGLSVTSSSPQTVDSVTLPSRCVPASGSTPDALGGGVQIWLQIYSAMGSGAPTITASYTDQDNNSGNTATAQGIVTIAAAGRTFPFILEAGDTGVRSIQTYTQSSSMTSGSHGLVMRRLITTIPIGTGSTGEALDALALGLARVYDGTCLEFVYQAGNTTVNHLWGTIALVEG